MVDAEVRARLAIALDTDDLTRAVGMARRLQPWFRVAKVGLELFSAAGPGAVRSLVADGFDVFADLKLHDIPTTVARACRVVGRLGPAYVTLHGAGGPEMLRAGADALAEGAADTGRRAPVALAVTVLTSDANADPGDVARRVGWALEAGCGGVVCAADRVGEVKALAPQLLAVTPGIRPEGTGVDDHAHASTPAAALAAGSDLLVIGRAVTAAPDPEDAARRLVNGLGPVPGLDPRQRGRGSPLAQR